MAAMTYTCPVDRTLESVYSNFDNELEDEVVKYLEDHAGQVHAHHAAWDFSGNVWLDLVSDRWVEDVWQYRMHVAQFISEPRNQGGTIMHVINKAIEEFGGR